MEVILLSKSRVLQVLASLWRNRALRICMLLYTVTFLAILPVLCRNWRFSYYFVLSTTTSLEALEEMKKDNTVRLNEAEEYLKQRSIPLKQEFARNIDVAVTVVTVSRNRHMIDSYEPKFLTQVIHRYLEMMEGLNAETNPLRVALSVCNVDRDPQSYTEVTDLSTHVHVFQRFSQTAFPMVHYLEKEKQDYVFCLNHSLYHQPRPSFVLLVEDDALPHRNLMAMLKFITLSNNIIRSKLVEQVAYVKLFHPERLLSYMVGYSHGILELTLTSLTVGVLLTLILTRIIYPREHKIPVTLACIIYVLLIQLAVGRPRMEQLRHYFSPNFYTLVPAPSCCTPAVLFPARTAITMIKQLRNITCGNGYGKDSAMETVVDQLGLFSMYALPNMFTHIGFYSALRDAVVDPFVV